MYLFLAVLSVLRCSAGFSLEWLLVGKHRLSSCGTRTQLPHGVWDHPGSGSKPVSPALQQILYPDPQAGPRRLISNSHLPVTGCDPGAGVPLCSSCSSTRWRGLWVGSDDRGSSVQGSALRKSTGPEFPSSSQRLTASPASGILAPCLVLLAW